LELLTQLAHTADTMAELQQLVDTEGAMLRKDFDGATRPHPALVELRAQRATYTRLIKALGLPSGILGDEPKDHLQRATAYEMERRALRTVDGA
jgi:hypothetical protein